MTRVQSQARTADPNTLGTAEPQTFSQLTYQAKAPARPRQN